MSPLRSILGALPDLPRYADPHFDFTMRQQAGVSVLMRAADPVHLLFIKRAENPRDLWSGHMALPGGRRESNDHDLLATAIRETQEETGIDLAPEALIGRLPRVAPRGPRVPRIVVVPFLFSVPAGTRAVGAPAEVERTRWISLDQLRDPAHREDYSVTIPAGPRTFPSIRVGDDVIWGMTYRIVEDLLLLDGEKPAGPGAKPVNSSR